MQQISLIHDLLLAFMQSKNAAMPCQRAPGSLDSPPGHPVSSSRDQLPPAGARASYTATCASLDTGDTLRRL
jgi:hypothetical protein